MVLRALQFFQESLQHGVLLVQTDKTTVLSYLNRKWGGGEGGGRVEGLEKLEGSVEWSLDQGVANLLFRAWGSPWADLFTTSANAKAPVSYSRISEPAACRGDALQADWSKGLLYMYPPIPLLHLSLHKIRREEADVIAIRPFTAEEGLVPFGTESSGRSACRSASSTKSAKESTRTSSPRA